MSSFGFNFLALSFSTELVDALRYKLQFLGIKLYGPANIFCDKNYVVKNGSVPNSMLNKSHNAICYHHLQESQVAGKILVGWIPGERNLLDLFTNTIMSGNIIH